MAEFIGEERRDQWYSNRDIYEMVQALRVDLQQTRTDLKQYNNLREQLADVQLGQKAVVDNCKLRSQLIDGHLQEQKGKHAVGEGIVKWSGWAVTLVMALANLYLILSRVGGG